MTIQEAIKSGLPFKRPSWKSWTLPDHSVVTHESNAPGIKYATKEDMLATDWVTKDLISEIREELRQVLYRHGYCATNVNLVDMISKTSPDFDPNSIEFSVKGRRKVSTKTKCVCNCRMCSMRVRVSCDDED